MTEFQARQIASLRAEGAGYRAIGTVVGLSRDIVRNYCKSHGLAGYGADTAMNLKERMALGYNCKCCGKQMQQPTTGRRRKFCSDQCRRQWWNAHPEEHIRKASAYYEATCAGCGKTFSAYGNSHRKYCCHACYVSARFGENQEETYFE